jgi:hypothetical protein
MFKIRLLLLLSGFLLSVNCSAQFTDFQPPQGKQVNASDALDRALKTSSLTRDGKPFHALMSINSAVAGYSGSVEVWWMNETMYRILVSSPSFKELKVVNGKLTQEKYEGDYYPRWLEDFVLALLNPVPMANNFQSGTVTLGPSITSSCIRRDDRPGGITDQLTWGDVCFAGEEPRIQSVLTFNHSMTYSDWKNFGKKKVAHTYETDVLDYKPVTGKLTTLEELVKPNQALFDVGSPSSADQRIETQLVSTLKEESMVETAPKIDWPSVREGKTEGYMIVYARTDRTGQVRETAKHNSDQPGLESFGMEQALRYKFKPLIIDGIARQMEMPLVLHFTSKLEDPVPILSVAEMKKQVESCNVKSAGSKVVTIRVSVNEDGKVTGMGPVGKGVGTLWIRAMESLRECRFAPYSLHGKVTYYKGDVEVAVP